MVRLVLIVIAAIFFASSHAIAGPYRVKPGDVIDISVWQEPKLDRSVIVGPDGTIALPLAGRFRAAGLTAAAIEARIKGGLQKQYTTELDVTVSVSKVYKPEAVQEPEPLDPLIYVTGEVAKPGQYPIKKRTTVLQAIAMSGGLSPFAADRRIQVYRKLKGDEEIFSFNYRDFERGDDMSGNIYLRDGDVVVVPQAGLFE